MTGCFLSSFSSPSSNAFYSLIRAENSPHDAGLTEVVAGSAGDHREAAGRAVLEVVRRRGPARRIAGPAGAIREMPGAGLIDNAWLDRIPRELRPRRPEKDRSHRYQTAAELARDVGHYLAHEPIEARRPSLANRVGKWALRHGSLVWSLGLLLLLCTVGSLASAVLISREHGRVVQAHDKTATFRRYRAGGKAGRGPTRKRSANGTSPNGTLRGRADALRTAASGEQGQLGRLQEMLDTYTQEPGRARFAELGMVLLFVALPRQPADAAGACRGHQLGSLSPAGKNSGVGKRGLHNQDLGRCLRSAQPHPQRPPSRREVDRLEAGWQSPGIRRLRWGSKDLGPREWKRDFLSTTAGWAGRSVAWESRWAAFSRWNRGRRRHAPFGHGLGRQHRQAGPRSQGEGGISRGLEFRWEAARHGHGARVRVQDLGCLHR